VKLEGDFDKGQLLLVDLYQPQVAIRWGQPYRKKFDVPGWAMIALRAEIGKLAAEEAIEFTPGKGVWSYGKLYVEPEPPGRDVFVGQLASSGRICEVVYHAKRRDRVMREDVLPMLSESPAKGSQYWSVFDLSCDVPEGWKLKTHRLNAGDLTLDFTQGKRGSLLVRQIGPAAIALKRQPLDKWLAGHALIWKKHHRVIDTAADHMTLSRRRRFFLASWHVKQRTILIRHDEVRDRIVIVDSDQESIARSVIETVGKGAADER
jgi:hypothetical protein